MKKSILFAAIVLAGWFSLNKYALPSTENESSTETTQTDAHGSKASTQSIQSNGIEIPNPLYDRPEEIVSYTGYTASYNKELKIPNWVAWVLTPSRLDGDAKRTNRFLADPNIEDGGLADPSDYRHSGYDRGHMCQAGDNKWCDIAMRESFYLSNICPQTKPLNSGDWNDLESKCRKWAQLHDTLFIVCGPVIEPNKAYQAIGENKVAVPEVYYKVVLRMDGGNPKAIGFLFPNGRQSRTVKSYAVTVDEVETATGINFFSQLPDHIEEQIEATYNWNDWK